MLNDADPLDPLITSRPAGVDVTCTPLRPVTFKVSVAVCGGGGCGVTVSTAVFVAPVDVAEIVDDADDVTVDVVMLKTPVCDPAATVIDAGTPATGLLLDSVTDWPPAGAAPVSVTMPCAPLPPLTLVGESCSDCSVTGPAGGVTVSVAVRVVPLYVVVIVTTVLACTAVVAIVTVAVKLFSGTVALAG